jgi:hypothetical protein
VNDRLNERKAEMARWYFSTNGKAEGPVTPDYLIGELKTGRFTLVDLVFKEGDSAWKTFGEIPEFRAAYHAPPAFVPPPPQPSSHIFARANEINLDEISFDDFTPTPIHSSRVMEAQAVQMAQESKRPNEFQKPDLEPIEVSLAQTFAPVILPESMSAKEFQKPDDGWPSDWRLSSSWIVLKKLSNGSGYDQDGPFSAEHIIEMIGDGKIDYSQYCWKPGYTRWFRIGNLPEFDRRKRDRENDTVNQIVPVPAITDSLPALSREELLENVERLRRDQRQAKEKGPQGTTGKNLIETSLDSVPVQSKKKIEHVPPHAPVILNGARDTAFDTPPTVATPPTPSGAGLASDAAWASAPMSSVLTASVAKIQKRGLSPKLIRFGLAAFVAAVVVFALVQATAVRSRQPASQPPEAAIKSHKPMNARPKSSMNEDMLPPAAPVIPIEVTKLASGLEITARNLDSAAPILTFQTDMAATDKIVVKLKAHTGDVLKFGSYSKTFDVAKTGAESPVLDLSKEDLPAGTYFVEAAVGSAQSSTQIFLGKKDTDFSNELERHIKSLSYRQQSEKSALFYGSQKLEKLTKDLATDSQAFKAHPLRWKKTFTAWRGAARDAALPVLALAQSPANEMTYPEEISAFQAATERLAIQAKEVDTALVQKRDVASASINDVASEFGKLREESAKLSGRPQASN